MFSLPLGKEYALEREAEVPRDPYRVHELQKSLQKPHSQWLIGNWYVKKSSNTQKTSKPGGPVPPYRRKACSSRLAQEIKGPGKGDEILHSRKTGRHGL